MQQTQATLNSNDHRVIVSPVVSGEFQSRGDHFSATSFRADRFSGLMDPLIMVDHFQMSEPTFGPHPHSGISAVTVIFEDSIGLFNNHDSLGNNVDLAPGDLYWLLAASGAVHDEKPHPGSRTHALQVFVDLPQSMRGMEPVSRHVKADEIPVLSGTGYRARLVLGESGGITAAASPALPMTILDVNLAADGRFEHASPANQTVLVLCLSGSVDVLIEGRTISVPSKHSLSLFTPGSQAALAFASTTDSRFVLMQGQPVRRSSAQGRLG